MYVMLVWGCVNAHINKTLIHPLIFKYRVGGGEDIEKTQVCRKDGEIHIDRPSCRFIFLFIISGHSGLSANCPDILNQHN